MRQITQEFTQQYSQSGVSTIVRRAIKQNIVAWNNVRNLSGDERLICFETSDDLIIIPRTAFLDLKQADEFLRAAKTYKGGGTPKFGGMQAVWPPSPSQAIPK